jgi:hypothetical protein
VVLGMCNIDGRSQLGEGNGRDSKVLVMEGEEYLCGEPGVLCLFSYYNGCLFAM